MAGKQGPQMAKAQKLIDGGMPVREAAIKAKVSESGIRHAGWFKAFRQAQKEAANA